MIPKELAPHRLDLWGKKQTRCLHEEEEEVTRVWPDKEDGWRGQASPSAIKWNWCCLGQKWDMRTERWVTAQRTRLWVLGHCAHLRTTGHLVFEPSHGMLILKVSCKRLDAGNSERCEHGGFAPTLEWERVGKGEQRKVEVASVSSLPSAMRTRCA